MAAQRRAARLLLAMGGWGGGRLRRRRGVCEQRLVRLGVRGRRRLRSWLRRERIGEDMVLVAVVSVRLEEPLAEGVRQRQQRACLLR